MNASTIEIKERPILFSAPMVQAILEGRKTMTRRLFKYNGMGQHHEPIPHHVCKDGGGDWIAWSGGGDKLSPNFDWDKKTLELYPNGGGIKCPYGKPGDRLWVRETWGNEYGGGYLYKASHEHMTPGDNRWRPSIHMPRAASRILLEITDVRVERVHDISEADAISEGVESWVEDRMKSRPTHYKIYYQTNPKDPDFYSSTAKVSFETLWQSINGPESWNENPFVWVITFKKI